MKRHQHESLLIRQKERWRTHIKIANFIWGNDKKIIGVSSKNTAHIILHLLHDCMTENLILIRTQMEPRFTRLHGDRKVLISRKSSLYLFLDVCVTLSAACVQIDVQSATIVYTFTS